MLAMTPRLLEQRPTVAMSLSSDASSCARVQKYVASSIPPRSGELADFALGTHAGEDALGALRGGFGFPGPAGEQQHFGEIASRLPLQQQALVQFGAADDFAQRFFGARQLILDDQRQCQDAQVF